MAQTPPFCHTLHQKISFDTVFLPPAETTDIGEKLDPLDVVFGQNKLFQPAVIAVKGFVFGWWHEGPFRSSTRNHFGHTF
jgi:hypothetical protein